MKFWGEIGINFPGDCNCTNSKVLKFLCNFVVFLSLFCYAFLVFFISFSLSIRCPSLSASLHSLVQTPPLPPSVSSQNTNHIQPLNCTYSQPLFVYVCIESFNCLPLPFNNSPFAINSISQHDWRCQNHLMCFA